MCREKRGRGGGGGWQELPEMKVISSINEDGIDVFE